MTDETTPVPTEAPKSPTERLAHLEQLSDGLVKSFVGFYGQLEEVKKKLTTMDQVLQEAMSFIGGVERCFIEDKAVTKDTLREAILANRSDLMKSQVEQYVKNGALKPAEVTTEQSFIVFREVGNDGTILNGRNQIPMANVKGELKEKFLGRKVGDLVTVLPDRSIELVEIYDITPPPQPETATPPPAPEAELASGTEMSDNATQEATSDVNKTEEQK